MSITIRLVTDLLLTMTAGVLYWPHRYGPLIGDDRVVLLGQPEVLNGDWRRYLRMPAVARRGILWLSYALNVRWAGGFTYGSAEQRRAVAELRITNMAIHAGSVLLIRSILGSVGFSDLAADVGALAVAVHPLAVPSVQSIAGRSSSLSGLFYFAAILAQLRGHVVLALIAAGLAMLSKEDAVGLPLVLAIMGKIVGDPTGAYWLWLAFYPLLLLATPVSRFLAEIRNDEALDRGGYPKVPSAWKHFILTTSHLLQNAIPWSVGVGIDLEPDPGEVRFSDWIRMAAVILIAMLAFGMAGVQGRLMILWLMLSPMTLYVFIPISDPIMMNRSYGMLLGVGAMVALMATASVAIASLLTIFLVFPLARHLFQCGDPVRYWRQALAESPHKPRIYISLGEVLVEQQRYPEAVTVYEEAVRRWPGFISANAALGALAINMNQLDRAKRILKQLAQIRPDCGLAWENIGVICYRENDLPKAEAFYREALKVGHTEAIVHYRLGGALYGQRRFEESVAEFQEAYRLRPDQPWYYYNVVAGLITLQRNDEAIQMIGKAPAAVIEIIKRNPILPPQILSATEQRQMEIVST